MFASVMSGNKLTKETIFFLKLKLDGIILIGRKLEQKAPYIESQHCKANFISETA